MQKTKGSLVQSRLNFNLCPLPHISWIQVFFYQLCEVFELIIFMLIYQTCPLISKSFQFFILSFNKELSRQSCLELTKCFLFLLFKNRYFVQNFLDHLGIRSLLNWLPEIASIFLSQTNHTSSNVMVMLETVNWQFLFNLVENRCCALFLCLSYILFDKNTNIHKLLTYLTTRLLFLGHWYYFNKNVAKHYLLIFWMFRYSVQR